MKIRVNKWALLIRIAALLLTFSLIVSLCACAGIMGSVSKENPPQLDLKIYRDSIDPVAAVQAEYYDISGPKPYFSRAADLNVRMWQFFLWEFVSGSGYSGGVKLPPWVSPTASYESKAGYAIVGNYLSVTRVLTMREQDEEPVTTFKAETYDMRDGYLFRPENLEYEGFAVWDIINTALANGKCKLIYPERDIPGAMEALRDSLVESTEDYAYYMQRECFFLTETGLGFYINERRHDEGDYWLFEIPYEDLGGMRSVLDG